jgi:hypothetical protein
MKPVNSSTVKAIGYDAAKKVLDVEFHHGGTYRYVGVPAELYAELEAAESPGKFLHAKIKGRFSFERVAAAPEVKA